MWREKRNTNVYMPEGWDKMTWEERVAAFLKFEDSPKRFDWPFPMAVFGTLREHQGNNRLMHQAEIQKVRAAFLPNFYCSGISCLARENGCAPFEVFYYTPEEWSKMLYRVDCLEGFDPEDCWHRRNDTRSGYYRTLAWLRLLPEGYVGEYFKVGRGCDLWGERDMALDPKEWDKYEKVPAWVYTSTGHNALSGKLPNSHVIWPIPDAGDFQASRYDW